MWGRALRPEATRRRRGQAAGSAGLFLVVSSLWAAEERRVLLWAFAAAAAAGVGAGLWVVYMFRAVGWGYVTSLRVVWVGPLRVGDDVTVYAREKGRRA